MGFFPDNYRAASASTKTDSPGVNEKYLELSGRYFKDGESHVLRPCGTFDTGHVIAGFSYFTVEGRPKRSAKYPENYQDDVSLTYQAKQQNLDRSDPANLDKPKYFLTFCAYSKECSDFVIVTLDKKTAREQFEEILSMEDYKFRPSGMANFYLTIKRKGEQLNTSYQVTPTLKIPTQAEEKRWEEFSQSIWLPALYDGADPFAGKPAGARPEGLPPTHRDALGADIEVATASAMPSDGW
jgi:hypothetical protein